jgi:CheY-like chemotaxis protein
LRQELQQAERFTCWSKATRDLNPLRSLTVLAVEDMEDSREAIRLMLQLRDGLEALEVMTTRRPDMVLCDLRMPTVRPIGSARVRAGFEGHHRRLA